MVVPVLVLAPVLVLVKTAAIRSAEDGLLEGESADALRFLGGDAPPAAVPLLLVGSVEDEDEDGVENDQDCCCCCWWG